MKKGETKRTTAFAWEGPGPYTEEMPCCPSRTPWAFWRTPSRLSGVKRFCGVPAGCWGGAGVPGVGGVKGGQSEPTQMDIQWAESI